MRAAGVINPSDHVPLGIDPDDRRALRTRNVDDADFPATVVDEEAVRHVAGVGELSGNVTALIDPHCRRRFGAGDVDLSAVVTGVGCLGDSLGERRGAHQQHHYYSNEWSSHDPSFSR